MQLRNIKNVITATLTFFSTACFSQAIYYDNINYAPTTPEVAAFGKFVETPVSLYSGIPDIFIPIGTISSGSVAVNVSLRYHAGGVKVEETASWVGTNWNLSAGGSVTRIVRGIADDASGGFLRSINTVQDFLSIPNNSANASQITNLIERGVSGELDYEADLYHYSFAGYIGSFFMEQNGQVIPMPHADIRIVAVKDTYGKIDGWVITAPDGTKGYFGKSKNGARYSHERVLHSIALSDGRNRADAYIAGWNLMDLEDYTGRNGIELTYVANSYSTCTRSGQQRYLNVQGNGNYLSPGVKPATYYETTLSSSKISSIKGANGTMTFIKETTQRQDLPGDYLLREIVFHSSSNSEVKRTKLNYEVKQSLGNSVQVPCAGNERFYRAFLASVQEFSGTSSLPPYILQYNNGSLPDKYSYSQDFFGFYNGRQNANLIPTATVKGVMYQGANRFTNETSMKAGTLERMTYPTGGNTSFTYEANRVRQLAFAPLIANRVQVNLVIANSSNLEPFGTGRYRFSGQFTVPPEYGLIDNRITVNVNFPCVATDRTCGIEFTLRKLDNSFSANITANTSFICSPGVYELTGLIENQSGIPDFSVRVSGESYENATNYAVGGLRIANIRHYDHSNILASERTYAYHSIGDESTSSGSITSNPVFVETDALFGNGGQSQFADIITAQSLNPFTVTQSNYVGYSNVTEYLGNKTQNTGKAEYIFSFVRDDDSGTSPGSGGAVSEGFPYPPVTVLEWLRGRLLKESQFVANGSGGYDTVRQVVNDYIYYRSPGNIFNKNVMSVKMGKRGNSMWGFTRYRTVSEWVKLAGSAEIVFRSGQKIRKVTTYQYHENSQRHVMPVASNTSRSEGGNLIEKKIYPDDVTGTSFLGGGNLSTAEYNAIGQLKKSGQHRIAEPVQIEIWRDGTKLSTYRTLYKDWGNGLIAPVSKHESMGSDPLTERITYYSYTDKGKPIETAQTSAPRVVYIWGYSGEYPVAEIHNAVRTEVVNTGFSQSVLDAAGSTEAQKQAELAKIRNHASLAKAHVTTYTYVPHIGLSSRTDASGRRISYEYDTFWRLWRVKDHFGNVVEEYKYNYRP